MKKLLIGLFFTVLTVDLYGSNKKWAEELSVQVDPRVYIISSVDNSQCNAYRDEIADEINEALTQGTSEALEACLKGKDLSQRLDFNESPLLSAIKLNKPYAISLLVRAGTPIDIFNEQDQTFVQVAQELGRQDVVYELERIKYEQNRPVVCESPANIARRSPARFSPLLFLSALYSGHDTKNK